MSPQEVLQRACDLFGPGTHIQLEITYGRADLGPERRAYWVFAGDVSLCTRSENSWEEAIDEALSRRTVKEAALKGILGGTQ